MVKTGNYTYEVIKTEKDIPVRCFRYTVPVGRPVPAHWHDSLEVVRVERGWMYVDVDQERKQLKQGDFLLISSEKIHATFTGQGTVTEVLQIPDQFLKPLFPDETGLQFASEVEAAEGRSPGEDCAPSEICKEAGLLIHRMCSVYEQRKQDYLLEFHMLLYRFLYILNSGLRLYARKEEEQKANPERQRLKKVMEFVNLHYREKIRLEEAAAQVALNKEYFCRFFRKSMGVSFMDYVNEVRFSRVCEELFDSSENIMTLLEAHGFGNYKLFMKMFREQYGGTPARMRREYQR